MRHQATQQHINQIADDIGRLRRRTTNELDTWTLERIANTICTLQAILEPTAAELAAWTAPGDPDTITAAIQHVDQRHNQLRKQLGMAS